MNKERRERVGVPAALADRRCGLRSSFLDLCLQHQGELTKESLYSWWLKKLKYTVFMEIHLFFSREVRRSVA